MPRNQTVNPPKEINGAKGIACLYLRKFIDKPTKQYIAANTYEKPTANNVPIGPNQRASIATNFESPFPIASFLKIYLAKHLKISKIKNDIKEEPTPLNKKIKSINSLPTTLIYINPKRPEINPKFTSPWGIQRQSISTKAIQINPKNSDAFFERGYSKYNLMDLKGALEDFNRALKIDPKINVYKATDIHEQVKDF